MKKLASSLVAVVACLGLAVVGCASKNSSSSSSPSTGNPADDQQNSDGSDASASESQASRFDQMLYGQLQSQDPNAAAGSLAAAQWWPAGCATRQKDATNPLVVHIHLDNCSGPFGMVKHSGDITVTFSKSGAGELHANATSANMTLNGKSVTYSSDADITIAGGEITVKYNGAWTRENGKGETVSHTRSGTTVIDVAAKCRTTNGTAQTNVAAREVDSTIKDYKICKKADGSDACPSGEVQVTGKLAAKTFTFDFDGSAECKVTGPAGNSIDVPLVCTP